MIFKRIDLQKKNKLAGLFILLIIFLSCDSYKNVSNQASEFSKVSIYATQIITDTLFKSNQRINLLMINKKSLGELSIDVGYNDFGLINTSQIAKNNNAIAAINGGFFDVDNGGSVTYFEKNDSVISRTRPPELKWAKADSIINGAILLTKNQTLKIQAAKTEQFYEKSKNETFVILNGPLLLKNSISQKLPNLNITNNRHPRTCLCTTKKKIIFITIDGREEQADGMNLFEVQKYLLSIGCVDAINLDGGGSTTMWTKDKGIVNIPSDKKGERPVSNAIIILKNH